MGASNLGLRDYTANQQLAIQLVLLAPQLGRIRLRQSARSYSQRLQGWLPPAFSFTLKALQTSPYYTLAHKGGRLRAPLIKAKRKRGSPIKAPKFLYQKEVDIVPSRL